MADENYGVKMMRKAQERKNELDAERARQEEERKKAQLAKEKKDSENKQKWDAQDTLVDILKQNEPSEEREKFIKEKSESLRGRISAKTDSAKETEKTDQENVSEKRTVRKNTKTRIPKREVEYY